MKKTIALILAALLALSGVAALAVEGVSIIDNVGLIDRGYQCIEQTLGAFGADIARMDEG